MTDMDIYPQWQPIDQRIQTLADFKKFVASLAESWGEDSEISLPQGFEITYIGDYE